MVAETKMKFLQANIVNLILSGGLAVLNMLLSIVEARVMGPVALGNYQIFVSTQTIVYTILALGLGNAGIYYINSGKTTSKEFVSTVLKVEILLASLAFCTLFLCVFFNEGYFGKISITTLIVYCMGSAATLFTTAITPVLLARFQIYKYQAVNYIATLLSFIAVGFLYLRNGLLDVQWMLVISGICKIISALLLLWTIRWDLDMHIPFIMKRFIGYLKFGIQYSMTNVAYILILNIPIYALTFFLSSGFESVGYFTRAVAICTIAMFVNKQIGPLLFAKLSSCNDEQKIENIRIMATFFFVFNLLMVLGIVVSAKWIVLLLYGEQYLPAVPLVKMLSLSVLFTGINELIGNVFSAIGKPRYIFFNLLISIIILVPLISVLIKTIGIEGAPIAVTFMNGITSLLLINTLRKHIAVSFSDFLIPTPNKIKNCYINIVSRIKK